MSFKVVLLMSALAAVRTQKPKCLITAPNIVHLGVEETVTVQLHGATKPTHVNMYFERLTDNKIISETQNVLLNDRNDYQAVVKMKVIPEAYAAAISGTNSGKTNTKEPPLIQLTAESEEIFQQNTYTKKYYAKKNMILSTRKGYIFIQTDKPIYNPGETVRFRVFTLDTYLMPVEESIQVMIFNSMGLMVHKQAVKESYIVKKDITIPDVEIAGHWTITASYLHHPMSNSTVQFEVREYVLPTYEVKIEALKPYYLLTEDSFIFNVTARYTYGKGVNGLAYVRFGLIDNEQGNQTYLAGLENKTQIQDGVVTIALPSRDLREKVHQVTEHLEGYSLYIAVTAIDTASGDLEEAESTVPIVNTPYIIDMSKTKEYFTPGGTFSILATTTYPDGTAAPHLRLKAVVTARLTEGTEESIKVESPSDSKGEVFLTFKAPQRAKSMDIKVFAEGEEEEVILSDAEMTVTAPQAEGGRFLSVEIEKRTLEPGQEMTIYLRDITPPNTPRPSHIYYMILSKGRVVQMSRIRRAELTTLRLPFSVDLVPSFRLLAYYFTEGRGLAETTIVADSVWADVRDICKGKIEILPLKERKPAEVFNVEVHTDQADMVALSAVDTAVYILNKNNKLTLQKMFDYMNSYDLACTMGGGSDYKSVLGNAGLAFITNVGRADTPDVRKDYTCQSQRKRHKRALDPQQEMSKIINRYKNQEKRCCIDGAKPRDLSCEQRHAKTQHQPQTCRKAFLKCCKDATKLRADIKRIKKIFSLGKAMEDVRKEEEMLNDVPARLRSYFPQTWMWDIVNVDPSGNIRHTVSVPDSITTWEVQAVGISAKKGFCIAEPKPLTVFQDFFVSLKLPYSVKRNEQLEVKAVVYNYQAESLEVTVVMAPADGLCSAAGDGEKQIVTVPANSAVPVYFTVVPLRTGNIPIHVDAYTGKNRDQIKKDLKVLGEGELFSQQTEYNIDARTANNIVLEVPIPRNSVPGLESDAYVSVKGGVMGQSVDNCLNLEGVDKLIALPKGCAEQTMVTMSPAIHAMNYLDSTGQWIDLRAERRDEALAMIQSGYSRILTFKKPDGSYGAFLSRPSSIWLTAFIAKELTQCRRVIAVEDSYIQESISYLVSKQLDSGAFNDPNPLYDRTMQGGVGGFEADVSLTAYVLIAMHQALPIYTEDSSSKLGEAIQKSQSYLEVKLDSLQRPFAVAITAYALSLTSSSAARQAQTKLRGMAKCDQEADTCHWEANKNLTLIGEARANQVPQAVAISVETTAYALLQTVAETDIHYAARIARWLTEQRKYGGGFQSTQDTVVALEALFKFSNLDNLVDNLDLNVELCEQGGKTHTAHITKRSALISPAFQITPGCKITVNVAGQGNGTISLVQTYRTLEQTETSCDYFNLSVSVEGEVKYKKSEDYDGELDDYDNYELEEEASDEPVSGVEWFDLRTRRKRQAPQEEDREKSLVYHVCVGMNKGTSAGMVIVDISLLSGLQPNIQDLEEIAKGTERYIDHYDIAPNKVFLYFDKITEDPQCVTFRAEQISPIGLVQPAGAVVYDYYNPERRCGLFYSPPQRSSMISKLCKKDVCSCAEGGCPRLKITYSKDMEEETRSTFACFFPIVDYAYIGKMINSSDDGVFKHHITQLSTVLQIAGKDVTWNGAVRDMITRKACQIDLKIGREYLIMGGAKTISDTTDDSGKPVYVLDNEMWLEEIPEENRCRASKNRRACNMLQDFMKRHATNKCHF